MVIATGVVTALPAYVASLVVPSGSALAVLGTLPVAIGLSIAAAKCGAALWMRHPLAREVVFADLMAWEWVRRLWVERQLTRAHRTLPTEVGAPHERAQAFARLAGLLEARDAYTHGHSRRVARHAARIVEALHVPAADAARIWTAATLHDIGKIRTPREILNKPGRLTDDEFDVIKRHPVDGASMLAGLDDPELVAIVRSHHERLDGAGYPDGLAGTQIPLGARIIAVADTFDAMTSTRSYRSPVTHKRALDVLRAEAGAQLDGAAVSAFLRTYSGRRSAAWSTLAALAPQRLVAWLTHETASLASLGAAAGWAAPVAAATAAVIGISSHAPRQAGARPPDRATAVAAVARAAAPARAPRLIARQPAALGRGRDTRPAPATHPKGTRRRPGPPAAAPAGALAPDQTAATPAADAASAPTPARGDPEVPVVPPTVADVVAVPSVPAAPPLPGAVESAASLAVEAATPPPLAPIVTLP